MSTDVSGAQLPAETVTEAQKGIPIKILGADSTARFPIIDRVWDVFSQKGIRTAFLSVGASSSSAPDLELAESLGCPINIVALTPEEREKWSEVAVVLKERKRLEPNARFPFSAGAEQKWILPKNIRLLEAMPWWTAGSVDISGCAQPVKAGAFGEVVRKICQDIKTRDGATRLDIVKVDTVESAPGLEAAFLGAMLNAGFRPAIVLVRWSRMPDTDLPTTLAAGHLVTSGYSLFKALGDCFLYYFTDNDMYQSCSWEKPAGENPIMTAILDAVKDSMRRGGATPLAPK